MESERLIDQIRNRADKHDYDGALRLIDKVEGLEINPYLLVLKGVYILVSEGDEDDYELEDAKGCFFDALELDPTYLGALQNLGEFEYSIQENNNEALSWFQKASSKALEMYNDAIEGAARCIAELESSEKAKRFVETTRLSDEDKAAMKKACDEDW